MLLNASRSHMSIGAYAALGGRQERQAVQFD